MADNLDRQIAIQIMDYVILDDLDLCPFEAKNGTPFSPSADWNHMRMLVDKMQHLGFTFSLRRVNEESKFICFFTYQQGKIKVIGDARDDEGCKAVALAAMDAYNLLQDELQ